jgi:DNA-binding beta-propeller fold protein YncE/phosphodiesterase/alkaline phosphatase D-like protein
MRREESNARVRVCRPNGRRVLLLLGVLAALLVFSSSALAIEVHLFSSKFGREVNETKTREFDEAGDPHKITEAEENLCTALSGNICQAGIHGEAPGQLSSPIGLAVNSETQAVYVDDSGNRRVQEFDAKGQFVLMFGEEVNETTKGNICTQQEVENANVKCKSGNESEVEGGFGGESRGIAIDNSTDSHRGDVFVPDSNNDRIEIFTASGAFIGEFLGTETPNGSFIKPTAVAVSPATGDVYVADQEHNAVVAFEYDSAESRYRYIPGSQISTSQTEAPRGVAVDAQGNVYVENAIAETVSRFSPAGVYQQTLSATQAQSVAVNAQTNDVYVGRTSASPIAEYDASGTLLLEFGSAITGGDNYVGVDSTSGSVYDAEEESNAVDMFEPSTNVPGIRTEGTTGVTEITATLHGGLEPFGLATTYFFEYGKTESLGTDAPIIPASAGITSTKVSESLSGLQPNTTYYYRLVGEAIDGPKYGAIAHFTTLAPAPTVVTGAAAGVTQTSATIAGEVDPEGAQTEYSFGYVPAAECSDEIEDYGVGCPITTAPGSPGSAGDGTVMVHETTSLSNLAPNTTYYYQLTATNGTLVKGSVGEFTTEPLAPEAKTLAAGEVGETAGVIYGAVNPLGAATRYYFEYGSTTSYGAKSPEADAGSTDGFRDLSQEAAGLQPDQIYHYRIVASTTGGIAYGEDMTFRTTVTEPYPVAPAAMTEAAANVFANEATLIGAVNPKGYETTYRFEYGTSAYYGAIVPLAGGNAGSGMGSHMVSEVLTGLQPGTTYHYRLAANNSGGTAYGEDETFTTSAELVAPIATAQTTTPVKGPAAVAKKKIQTKAEKLKATLAKCKKSKGGRRRSCEKQARKKYATKSKPKARKTTKPDGAGKAGR